MLNAFFSVKLERDEAFSRIVDYAYFVMYGLKFNDYAHTIKLLLDKYSHSRRTQIE